MRLSYSTALHHLLVIITFIHWLRISFSLLHISSHMVKDILIMVSKVVFPYIGIKSLFPSKYIVLLILVWLQIENEESFFLRFNLQFIHWTCLVVQSLSVFERIFCNHYCKELWTVVVVTFTTGLFIIYLSYVLIVISFSRYCKINVDH